MVAGRPRAGLKESGGGCTLAFTWGSPAGRSAGQGPTSHPGGHCSGAHSPLPAGIQLGDAPPPLDSGSRSWLWQLPQTCCGPWDKGLNRAAGFSCSSKSRRFKVERRGN